MIDLQDLRLRERLQELDLREWLNENSAVTTVAAVVLLMVALGIMLATVTGGGGPRVEPPTAKFFYDLNTRELFEVPLDALPPVERGEPFVLPGGFEIPAGVEAFVFAPEGGNEDDWRIAWVETLLPERRAELLELRQRAAADEPDFEAMIAIEQSFTERLVMDPNADPPRFFPRFSDEGIQVVQQDLRTPEGEPLRPVFPD